LNTRHFPSPIVASLLAGALAFGSLAHAQTKPPAKPRPRAPAVAPRPIAPTTEIGEAKRLFSQGEKKHKDGDYEAALKDFQAADAIKGTPQTARFIGICLDELHRYPDAVQAYERFLANVPAPLAKEAERIRDRIAKIKDLPGKLRLEVPPGAKVSVDGKDVSTGDIELAPGKHTLAVRAAGFEPYNTELLITFASVVPLKPELKPVAAVVPPPPPPVPPPLPPPEAPKPEPRSLVPAYVTGGIALAAAGVGTVYGIMALNDKSKYNQAPSTSRADDGENHALIADMSLFLAITLGVTSAVLYFTKDEPATTTGSAQGRTVAKRSTFTVFPTPIVTTQGGGAGALVRF
jgi:tetratricopeptide (TPR) repeat protein